MRVCDTETPSKGRPPDRSLLRDADAERLRPRTLSHTAYSRLRRRPADLRHLHRPDVRTRVRRVRIGQALPPPLHLSQEE